MEVPLRARQVGFNKLRMTYKLCHDATLKFANGPYSSDTLPEERIYTITVAPGGARGQEFTTVIESLVELANSDAVPASVRCGEEMVSMHICMWSKELFWEMVISKKFISYVEFFLLLITVIC